MLTKQSDYVYRIVYSYGLYDLEALELGKEEYTSLLDAIESLKESYRFWLTIAEGNIDSNTPTQEQIDEYDTCINDYCGWIIKVPSGKKVEEDDLINQYCVLSDVELEEIGYVHWDERRN